jgi:hypothetical protein
VKKHTTSRYNQGLTIKRLNEYTTAQRATALAAQCTRLRADDVRHNGNGYGLELLPEPVTGPGTDCPHDPADWPEGRYTLDNTGWNWWYDHRDLATDYGQSRWGVATVDIKAIRADEARRADDREARRDKWAAVYERMGRTADGRDPWAQPTTTGGSVAKARSKVTAAAASDLAERAEAFLTSLESAETAPAAPASRVGNAKGERTGVGIPIHPVAAAAAAAALQAAREAALDRAIYATVNGKGTAAQVLRAAREASVTRAVVAVADGQATAAQAVRAVRAVRLEAAAAVTVTRTDSPAGSFLTF